MHEMDMSMLEETRINITTFKEGNQHRNSPLPLCSQFLTNIMQRCRGQLRGHSANKFHPDGPRFDTGPREMRWESQRV